jgi:hypothetical protein
METAKKTGTELVRPMVLGSDASMPVTGCAAAVPEGAMIEQ